MSTDISAQPAASAGDIAATLRIVKGEPTPEQIAAVVAALTSAQAQLAAQAPENSGQRSRWATPHLRQPLVRGTGAWRHSLRNR